jgi:hypothetical protein
MPRVSAIPVAMAFVAVAVGGCSDAPAVVAPSPIPAAQLGPMLEPATFAPQAAGFALEVADGVVLTTTRGVALGHLPGWTLDRPRSDRLAAPVLVGPDGDERVVTGGGLLPMDAPLPAANRRYLRFDPTGTAVLGPRGSQSATLPGPMENTWVSATADVVSVVDNGAVDLETDEPLDLDPGCRVADRHRDGDPLLVCDGGAVLRGGPEVPAPEGQVWRWVTTGITGDEILATTATSCGGRQAWIGTRSEGRVSAVSHSGGTFASEALFVRSSGDVWIALLGDDCSGTPAPRPGLFSRSAGDGTLERLGEVWPGLTAAAIWVR